MSYNITPEQQLSENLDQKASTWAYRVMTLKLTNDQCKFEIAQQIEDTEDMQDRVRKYLKAGLITEETFKTPAQKQMERIKQQAKAPPEAAQSITGSKDGLWTRSVRGR